MKDNIDRFIEEHAERTSTWMEKTGGFAKDMTMRDHYAGLAMLRTSVGSSYEQLAKTAYEIADAMLKAREK
jgi:hypothetical protein